MPFFGCFVIVIVASPLVGQLKRWLCWMWQKCDKNNQISLYFVPMENPFLCRNNSHLVGLEWERVSPSVTLSCQYSILYHKHLVYVWDKIPMSEICHTHTHKQKKLIELNAKHFCSHLGFWIFFFLLYTKQHLANVSAMGPSCSPWLDL